MEYEAMYAEFQRLKGSNFPLEDLDPICAALNEFQKKHRQAGYPGRVLPNRIVALAAVRFMEAAVRDAWERE